MRPLWVSFPADTRTWDMDKQFMSGGDLMAAPVFTQGATSVAVYFPTSAGGDGGAGGAAAGSPWFDVATGQSYAAGTDATVAAPIEKIPVFQRGGSVVPRQMRLRRSSVQMVNDPYTLTVARDAAGTASGRLYLDAGDGFEYRKGAYAYRKYTYSAGVLTSTALHASAAYTPTNLLERLEILLDATEAAKVTSVTLAAAGQPPATLEFSYASASGRLVVRAPKVLMASDWSITIA